MTDMEGEEVGGGAWEAFERAMGLLNGYIEAPEAAKVPDLREAIGLFERALREYPEETLVSDRGLTLCLLGMGRLYLATAEGNSIPELERAIPCYEAAIPMLNREEHAAQWALAQSHLGFAYRQLPAGRWGENRLRSVEHYEASLEVYTEEAYPSEWAQTQRNLGLGYATLANMDLPERQEHLERAIAYNEAAMRIYTREAFPEVWADLQNSLGGVYRKLPTGDRKADVAQAIACYEAALAMWTEAEHPEQWAECRHNLGLAYYRHPTEDRAEDLMHAIEHYEAALRVYTQEALPTDWARTQYNLGLVYQWMPTGDREADQERSILYFEASLEVYTPETYPTDWALSLDSLGKAYQARTSGERRENLERAAFCYEAALQIRTEADYPLLWAQTLTNLGLASLALAVGDNRQSMATARDCFEATLRVYDRDRFPVEWAKAQRNLGDALGDLPGEERDAHMRDSIRCYEAALEVFTQTEFPEEWGGALNSMGLTYTALPTGDRRANLQRALLCYEAALQVRTETDRPTEWAITQHNLGYAYQAMPGEDREANLQRALTHLEAALRVFTPEEFPTEWARSQNARGTIYSEMPGGDRGAHLLMAASCFEAATQVRTEADYPTDWAMTQNNLGVVFQVMPIGDPEENWRRSVSHYEAALRVYTQADLPVEWARAQINLTGMYQQIPTEENLRKAIACAEGALQVFTPENAPAEWALIQNNLGGVYVEMLAAEGEETDVAQRALDCYEAALRIYTQEAYPFEWARAQNNIGLCWQHRPEGEQEENQTQAILHFRNALQVYSPETFPHDHLATLEKIVAVLVPRADWAETLAVCREGIEALESLRTVALTPAERTRLLTVGLLFFDRAVLSCYHLGQFEQALAYAERGKTRNLVDNFARQVAQPRGVEPEQWSRYRQLLTEIHTGEQQLAAHYRAEVESGTSYGRLQAQVTGLRAERERMEADFHALDPDYLPAIPALTFEEIRAVVAESEAILVEFRVMEEGTLVFLLGPEDTTLEADQVLHLPDFTVADLRRIVAHFEGDTALSGWLIYYDRFLTHGGSDPTALTDWQECIEDVTADLAHELMLPIHRLLQARYPEQRRVLLSPNKHLNLLPLHAAYWWEEGERRYFLDLYEVQYAPSCTVLRICQERARGKGRPTSLFAVQNPANGLRPLPYSAWEVAEAARHFAEPHILAQDAATLPAVRESIHAGEELFFSCHGFFDPLRPAESYFALSGDARLGLGEILQHDLSRTSLAILGACESALSDVGDITDELQGLHTAFLLARVPTVIGGLWSVDDLATAFLMTRFHHNLYILEMRTPQALQQAQQWVRNLTRQEAEALLTAAPALGPAQKAAARRALRAFAAAPDERPFASPYWWAAFQCLGAA